MPNKFSDHLSDGLKKDFAKDLPQGHEGFKQNFADEFQDGSAQQWPPRTANGI